MDRRKQASGREREREREIGLANSKGAAGARGSALEESYCVCYRLLNRRSDFVSACLPAFLPACRDALLHISSAARCIVCCDMIFFEGVCSREGHARFSLSLWSPDRGTVGFLRGRSFCVTRGCGGGWAVRPRRGPPLRPLARPQRGGLFRMLLVVDVRLIGSQQEEQWCDRSCCRWGPAGDGGADKSHGRGRAPSRQNGLIGRPR